MISSLLPSVLIEGVLAAVYALWRRRPVGRLLLAVTAATILTQFLLWVALNLNPAHYLPTLLAAEALIWLIEGAILHLFPGTQLSLAEALALSLAINLASFGIGWFLPV